MYTAMAVFDILDLINIGRITSRNKGFLLDEKLCFIAKKGLFWLQTMSHPDGDISFFNDSSKGIAPKISYLLSYASTLGVNPSQKIDTQTLTTLERVDIADICWGKCFIV